MRLPRRRHAVVPKSKVLGYLLSRDHPSGWSKARFFERVGFRSAQWQILARSLRQHAVEHPVSGTQPSPFGRRYVIEGVLETPSGKRPIVRSVWFIAETGRLPRLVTAYPIRSAQP